MEHKRGSTGLFLILIAFAMLVFVLDTSGIALSVRAVSENIVGSIARKGHNIRAMSFANDRIVKLEEERNSLLQQVAELEKLKSENENLRLQLGLTQQGSKQTLLLADVLTTSRLFIINKGQDDGVVVGNVVVFKHILVGKIVSVSKKASRVLLPIDKESIVAARAKQTGAKGLIRGEVGGARFSEVLLSETLTDADTLVTVGDVDEHGRGIPPGLFIGTIEQIRKSDDELFQEAKVVPLLDFARLTQVFVIL